MPRTSPATTTTRRTTSQAVSPLTSTPSEMAHRAPSLSIPTLLSFGMYHPALHPSFAPPPPSRHHHVLTTVLSYAIKGSPNQKLLLEDIYYAIESRVSVQAPPYRPTPPCLTFPPVSVFQNCSQWLEGM